MLTQTKKKIFGWAMIFVFLCAVMLLIYFIHNIITTSDAISSLKLMDDITTADKIATAELINTYKWNLYGGGAWLITTFIVTTILELVLYNQICPFVEKTLPVCQRCGMTLEDELPFCPYCGNDMTKKEPNVTNSMQTRKSKTTKKED